MRRKIIGVTVGTTISPKKIERVINPVKRVNGVMPDENGNVDAVHIGPEAPTNGEKVWIDTSEEVAELDGTAAVGQIFMVTEVDAEGKPVKWKAVDMPKGETPDHAANEGEKGHILNRTHYVDEKGIVHKLPNQFIDADWMATKKDGGAGKTIFIPEQTVDGFWGNLQGSLVEGTVYAVEVNGILYRCVCRNDRDGTLYLGNGSLLGDTSTPHNNEPFCIGWLTGTGGAFYKDGTLEAPIGIKVTNWQDVVYNKLPEEYLPENVVKGEGGKVGWDNVSGKPFSQDAGELLFSHTATFATDAGVEKVTGVTLSLVEGAEYWLDVNGDMLKCHYKKIGTLEWVLYDTAGNRWLRKAATAIYVYGQTAGTTTYKLYGLSENVVLDPQYIPPNVAQKKDIPNVSGYVQSVNGNKPNENGNVTVETGGGGVDVTAEVGQTIIVEEVDAEGKPTKWKSADYQPRTHYEIDNVPYIPETTIAISEGSAEIAGDMPLIEGEKYTVNYNGMTYECVCIFFEMLGALCVGELGEATGEYSGEPFIIASLEVEGAAQYIVIPLDEATQVTLSIFGKSIVKIPDKYMSDIAKPLYVRNNELPSQEYLFSQYARGRVIIGVLIGAGAPIHLPLTQINQDDGSVVVFSGAMGANIYTLTLTATDGVYSDAVNIVEVSI